MMRSSASGWTTLSSASYDRTDGRASVPRAISASSLAGVSSAGSTADQVDGVRRRLMDGWVWVQHGNRWTQSHWIVMRHKQTQSGLLASSDRSLRTAIGGPELGEQHRGGPRGQPQGGLPVLVPIVERRVPRG